MAIKRCARRIAPNPSQQKEKSYQHHVPGLTLKSSLHGCRFAGARYLQSRSQSQPSHFASQSQPGNLGGTVSFDLGITRFMPP